MVDQDNEAVKLVDSVISGSNELVNGIKSVMPEPVAESMTMFQESNVVNLKKIRKILDNR